jgi:hypothetical protein
MHNNLLCPILLLNQTSKRIAQFKLWQIRRKYSGIGVERTGGAKLKLYVGFPFLLPWALQNGRVLRLSKYTKPGVLSLIPTRKLPLSNASE